MFDLLCAALATWRVSKMLTNEVGPFRMFERLREATGIQYDSDGKVMAWSEGTPLVCFWCTSVWVAPVMVAFPWLARVFATGALAIFVETMCGGPDKD